MGEIELMIDYAFVMKSPEKALDYEVQKACRLVTTFTCQLAHLNSALRTVLGFLYLAVHLYPYKILYKKLVNVGKCSPGPSEPLQQIIESESLTL